MDNNTIDEIKLKIMQGKVELYNREFANPNQLSPEKLSGPLVDIHKDQLARLGETILSVQLIDKSTDSK